MLKSISADETITVNKSESEPRSLMIRDWTGGAQALRTETKNQLLSCFFNFKKKRTKINNNEEFDPGSG